MKQNIENTQHDIQLVNDIEVQASRMEMAELYKYMAVHYNKSWSTQQLAELVGLSPKYFGDLFKKTYGYSAMDYLTSIRMNHAKKYLRDSNARLREIAQLIGYSDEFYFSRKFKKEVGVPPSAYISNPYRNVAALTTAAMGQLLALGIIPVAAPLDAKWAFFYYHAYSSHIKVHLNLPMPHMKQYRGLVQAKPDVVLGSLAIHGQAEQVLRGTGLKVFVPSEQDSWSNQLEEMASFLNRESQFRSWMQVYNTRVELAKEMIQKVIGNDTCLVLRLYRNQLYVYRNKGIRDVLYQDLQLASPCDEQEVCNEPISLEELNRLNSDRILLLICPEARTRASWLTLQHEQQWRALKAVRSQQLYLIPSDPWYEYSAVAISRMLDEVAMMFTGNCPKPILDSVHGDLIKDSVYSV